MTAETAAQFAVRMDAITTEELVARGSMKWTAFPESLPAWVAEMDFGIAPEIRAAVQDALDRDLTGYVPASLRLDLKRAAADFQADRYGWTLDPARVTWLPDVLTGLAFVLTHLMPHARKLAVLTPCYMPFMEMPQAWSRELIQVPMRREANDWTVDYDGLAAAFAAGAELLIFANPHNPIGKVYDRAELLRISDIVEAHGARVFSDEIHAPLTFPGVTHIPYASISGVAAEHSITAISSSKAFNTAGLKCAQLVLTNDSDLDFVANAAHGLPYESSVLGVVASIAAYRDGRYWLDNALAYLDRNRTMVSEAMATLPGVRYLSPEGTYLAWLDLSQLALPVSVEEDLASYLLHETGVALTDGGACGAAGRGSVRLNFATPRPIVAQMLDRLARVLH